MGLLNRLLEKKGIKPEELSKEESQTIEGWKKTLSEGEITLEKVGEFCELQLSVIKGLFKDLDNSKEKLEKLVTMFNVYSSILGAIKSPQAQRESLEKYLISLLDEKHE